MFESNGDEYSGLDLSDVEFELASGDNNNFDYNIFNNQVLPMMQGKSNFENVLLSLVANPSNNMNSDEVSVVGISKNNLSASWVSDARIGGFGIFFFESVLLALILFISTGYSRRMACA